MLLGSAKAAHSLGVKIFESSPVVEVNYGKEVRVRTAMGSVKAAKLLWACDSFLNNLEPEIYNKTLVTYSYQVSTEPLSDELIERISPLRGASSAIFARSSTTTVLRGKTACCSAAPRATLNIRRTILPPGIVRCWRKCSLS